jgi:hypothetical protein
LVGAEGKLNLVAGLAVELAPIDANVLVALSEKVEELAAARQRLLAPVFRPQLPGEIDDDIFRLCPTAVQ